jgi:hypothetical protein
MEMTMKTTLKLTLLAAIGAASLAAPASAQPNHRRQQGQHSQPYFPASGVLQNDTVIEGGQYLGRDPDPNVRSQILKDDSEYNGNV